MSSLLAVDGGGTKTVALLCDEDGCLIGQGHAGPSNPSFVSVAAAEAAIEAAVAGALKEAAAVRGPADVTVAVCGGPVRPAIMEAAVRRRVPGADYAFFPEADCCLASADGAQHGAVVLAGTGCFEYARGRDGRSHRTDGWGSLFGDEGSAHDIVRRALIAVARAEDGRGPETALHGLFLDQFGETTLRGVSGRIYGGNMQRHEIAQLAPLVTGAAFTDEVAAGVLEEAAHCLALGVITCIRRAGLPPDEEFSLVLCGGVFRAGDATTAPLVRAVRSAAPGHGQCGLSSSRCSVRCGWPFFVPESAGPPSTLRGSARVLRAPPPATGSAPGRS